MKTFLNLQKNNRKALSTLLFILPFTLYHSNSYAQLQPVSAVYFFNEYLINPAMAGRETNLNLSLGLRKQGMSFSKTPASQYLSADFGFSPKSGIGLIVYNDKAGVLSQTSAAVTYAYHLPLAESKQLHFGLSATLSDYHLDNGLVSGDPDDPDVLDVNTRKGSFNNDFGMAFTSKRLSIQATLPNLLTTVRNTRKNETNYAIFFSSISYRFQTSFATIEPKSMFRGIKGFKNILDVGSNFSIQSRTPNKLNILALYHSTNSATVGFGVSQDNNFSFQACYTTGTSQMRTNTDGDFEIGLSLKIR